MKYIVILNLSWDKTHNRGWNYKGSKVKQEWMNDLGSGIKLVLMWTRTGKNPDLPEKLKKILDQLGWNWKCWVFKEMNKVRMDMATNWEGFLPKEQWFLKIKKNRTHNFKRFHYNFTQWLIPQSGSWDVTEKDLEWSRE